MGPPESRRGFDPVLWHTLSSETVFAHLKSTPTGLTEIEAAQRLAEHGPNELQAAYRISPWTILLEQFKNVLILMLLVATALSAFLGHGIEAISIAIIVLFVVLLGFVRRKPRNPRTGIFTRPIVTVMVVGGFWSAAVNLGLFAWALNSGRSIEQAMTMIFVSLVLIESIKAYNFRSDRHSVLNQPFANRWLNLAIIWGLALLAAIVYAPFLHEPFSTFSLSLVDWAIVVVVASTISPVLESAKQWMERRGWFGEMS